MNDSKLPLANCEMCPLYSAPKAVPGSGPLDTPLIIVGEAPGAHEEIEGIPFVGESGRLLDAALEQAGLEFGSDMTFKTNVVACRPLGNREPTELEVQCCRPRLLHELEQISAVRVLALGNTALNFFGIPTSQRGAVYSRLGKNVMGAWHPAYVLRSPDDASEFLQCVQMAAVGPMTVDQVPYPEVVMIDDLDTLEKILTDCPDNAWVAFDIETDQVQWYPTREKPADMILMLQLAWEYDTAYVVTDTCLYDTDTVRLVDILQKFFNRVRTVGHNAKFDVVFLQAHFGLKVHQDFDTMLAHYCLDENTPHGLKAIARIEFGMPDYEEETIKPYLNTRNDRYSKVPTEILAKYGCMDVVVTLRLRAMFAGRLRALDMYEWPFDSLLMRAANVLAQVEIRGLRVDFDQLGTIGAAFDTEIAEYIGQIREMAGNPDLNPASTKQMAEFLYDQLHLPIVKGRKIKPRSTAHEALVKLKGLHPVIEILMQLRRISKMKSSYVENLLEYAGIDDRVHANFVIQGTEVGRLSVRDPALQTIPRADDYYGALIRSAFIPSPGHKLLIADYSQAELRVFADQSSEPFLIDVYANGRDLHSEVAVAMYGEGYTKAQRVQCKMFNFSYLYGGNEHSFAQDAGLDIRIATKFVQDYNRLMPVGLAYKRKMLETLKEQGYVTSRFNRRRHFPLITTENADEARKACVHMPTAASASDLTLLSACDLADMGVNVVLTVHDSVLVDCLEEDVERVGTLMTEVMTHNGEKWFPKVPWKVDLEVRDRWADPPPPNEEV